MNGSMIRPTRRSFLALGGAALLSARAAWAEGIEAISGAAFGATWHAAAPAGSGLAALRPEIEAIFAEVDRQMSPWRADSEISRYNTGAAGRHPVSAETAEVAAAALALTSESGGAFDPTVGPLVARWGFGPIAGQGGDWRGIGVDPAALTKRAPGLTLDLCGIAKGRALDRAMARARASGHRALLFDLGGELAALGSHPSGRPWQVAVEDPRGQGAAPAVLRLHAGMAVATSGLSAQSYAAGTRRYGHIIDPAAAAPAEGALRSVTVLAPTAMEADGWATALFAAGARAGPDMARSQGISTLFLLSDGSALRQIRTGGIAEVLL